MAPAEALTHQGKEEHGVEDIAQFFLKRAPALCADRVKHLPRFFNAR